MRSPRLAGAEQVLDFGRPVAVMLMAILQHLSDEDDPYQVVATLIGGLPSGSYLALSHPAKDIDAAEMAKMAESLNQMMAEKVTFRDRDSVTRWNREWCRRRNGAPTARRRRRARPRCGREWPASPSCPPGDLSVAVRRTLGSCAI